MFGGCCGCVNKKKLPKTPNLENKNINEEVVVEPGEKINDEIIIPKNTTDIDIEKTNKIINNEIKSNIIDCNVTVVIAKEDNLCKRSINLNETNIENNDIDKDINKINNGINKTDDTNGLCEIKENIDNARKKSDGSNTTVEEVILIHQEAVNTSNDNHKTTIITNIDNENVSDNVISEALDKFIEPTEIKREGCLLRRGSSKSSIKKKVNYRENTEIIPATDLTAIMDDDEVFCDSIAPQMPRGDMCTPYQAKRGSIPCLVELPDWFSDDREDGGILEPPVTPVGRDELALKRHRFFSELLIAVQATSEHRVRFDPLGPAVAEDSNKEDYDTKLSKTTELENLIGRLERIVERLERSTSARDFDFTNQAINTVIRTAKLPQPYKQLTNNTPNLINKNTSCFHFESELTPINEQGIINLSNLVDAEFSHYINKNESFENNNITAIDSDPIILNSFHNEKESLTDIPVEYKEKIENMSVNGYQDIVEGPLAEFLALSTKIGGDVAKQADFVKQAFNAQLQYITLATTSAQPSADRQMDLLKPTSNQITVIQEFREKNRASPFFNHLSAISESIPALGWVCVAPTPGPHVKEMNDAGQFYTNRVLKDWKEKDVTHVNWARSWVQTLTELQQYIKKHHTTGLVWSGKGNVGSCPPPPPMMSNCPPLPPPIPLADLQISADGTERNALFAQINQGENITKNLKKVTADMQTHKNHTLRTGPAPFITPQPFKSQDGPKPVAPATKPPSFVRDGKKWLIEYQKSNTGLLVENAEMNNVVYMFKCQDSTLTVKGKINSIVIDSCKKCSILFESLVSSIEFVNCQSVQMQVLGKVPTISIDKTDGCQMYLSADSLAVEIISSKSSEMNVLIPNGSGDYAEQPIPEQFKTTISGKSLKTTCVESLG